MKDEQLSFLKSVFGLKRGLSFVCKASPISKQSKDILRKQLYHQLIKKRIVEDDYLTKKSPVFFEGDLYIEINFSLNINRKGRKSDLDNLAKNCLDCLKGILFKDDSQIKELHLKKHIVAPRVTEFTGIRIAKI